MTKNYLHYLRKRAIIQHQKVDLLLNLLCGNTSYDGYNEDMGNEIIIEESQPATLSDLSKRHVQKLERYTQQTRQTEHLLHNEKEPASALFLKLSQMSLKWLELELAIVKELQRKEDTEALEVQEKPLNEEELTIVKDYLIMLDEQKTMALLEE